MCSQRKLTTPFASDFISPRTGPLAVLGIKTDGGFISRAARFALANGMTVAGKHYQGESHDSFDSQSISTRSSQLQRT